MRTGNRMAGMEGVEPPLTEPESAVLPLDDIPIDAGAPQRKQVLYGMPPARASPNLREFCGSWTDHGEIRRAIPCERSRYDINLRQKEGKRPDQLVNNSLFWSFPLLLFRDSSGSAFYSSIRRLAMRFTRAGEWDTNTNPIPSSARISSSTPQSSAWVTASSIAVDSSQMR